MLTICSHPLFTRCHSFVGDMNVLGSLGSLQRMDGHAKHRSEQRIGLQTVTAVRRSEGLSLLYFWKFFLFTRLFLLQHEVIEVQPYESKHCQCLCFLWHNDEKLTLLHQTLSNKNYSFVEHQGGWFKMTNVRRTLFEKFHLLHILRNVIFSFVL